jgi:hypothetical protein
MSGNGTKSQNIILSSDKDSALSYLHDLGFIQNCKW